MDWQKGRRSDNVEDRRDSGGSQPRLSTNMGQQRLMGLGKSKPAMLVMFIFVLFTAFTQKDPSVVIQFLFSLLNSGGQSMLLEPADSNPQFNQSTKSRRADEASDFIRVMMASNEDVWQEQFQKRNIPFRPTKLVLFSDRTKSGCGMASSQTGPFYCPLDEKIYIDLTFIRQMQQLGASQNSNVAGNFAMGYVIAHEYGHHIHNILGILPKAQKAMHYAGNKAESNALSVRLELQADCFAGVWAANIPRYNIALDEQDIAQGIQAAKAVGDDHILQSYGQKPYQENFTHGSSQQRMQWLKAGIKTGDMSTCDTFKDITL